MPRPVRNVEYDDNKTWLTTARTEAERSQYVFLADLPTADPEFEDALWNNAGTPTISAG
jgi:hypothetical protein